MCVGMYVYHRLADDLSCLPFHHKASRGYEKAYNWVRVKFSFGDFDVGHITPLMGS